MMFTKRKEQDESEIEVKDEVKTTRTMSVKIPRSKLGELMAEHAGCVIPETAEYYVNGGSYSYTSGFLGSDGYVEISWREVTEC